MKAGPWPILYLLRMAVFDRVVVYIIDVIDSGTSDPRFALHGSLVGRVPPANNLKPKPSSNKTTNIDLNDFTATDNGLA